MKSKKLSILVLIQDINATAQLSRQAQSTVAVMEQRGFSTKSIIWGSRRIHGGLKQKKDRIIQLIQDIFKIYKETMRTKYDVLYVHTHHDIKTVFRELSLLIFVRKNVESIILYSHGSSSHLLVNRHNNLLKILSRILISKIDGLFLLSTQEINEWNQFYKSHKYHYVSNPYTIDDASRTRILAYDRKDNLDGVTKLLFVGRLLEEKGVFDVIDVADLLRQSRVNFHLTIIGDGPSFQRVQEKIRGLTLEEYITMAGNVSHPEILNYYLNSDMFIFSGHGPEGFPTVLSEAMVSGLPIITTPVYGIRDRLKENRNCIFVNPNEPGEISQAVIYLANNPNLCQIFRANNMEDVKAFDPSIISNQQVDLILSITYSSHCSCHLYS